MIGITFPELLRFFIQVSAGAAGAASLWGMVFSVIALKRKSYENPEKRQRFFQIASILQFLFGLFFIIFLALWWFGFLAVYPPLSMAHEGIKINPTDDFIRIGFLFNFGFVSFLTIIGILNLYLWKFKNDIFRKWSATLFFSQLLLLSIIIAFSAFTGQFFTKEQLFYSFHNWHSILTLGSVIVVDILYISTLTKDNLKRILYPFFPWISMVIWVGLGLDFLSVVLVFEEALKITPQFFLSQTVVAIIILNGLLLSERLNNILIKLVRPDGVLSLPSNLAKIASVSGAISLASWTTITFVDFFKFNVGYLTLLTAYFLFIVFIFLIEPIVAKTFTSSLKKVSPDY